MWRPFALLLLGVLMSHLLQGLLGQEVLSLDGVAHVIRHVGDEVVNGKLQGEDDVLEIGKVLNV